MTAVFREKREVKTPALPCVKHRLRVKLERLEGALAFGPQEQTAWFRDMVLRSGLAVSMCEGEKFPKISLGPATGAGCESGCEYLDVYLEAFVPLENAAEKIRKAAAPFYNLVSVKGIPYYFPSVESAVKFAEYEIEADFKQAIMPLPQFFGGEEIKFTLHGGEEVKEINIKPSVYSFEVMYDGRLKLILKTGMSTASKPENFMAALFGTDQSAACLKCKILRRELYWQDSNGRLMLP